MHISTDSQLQPGAFAPLPLGTIKPRGWLLDQCRVQLNGLTTYLAESWPDIAQSKWIGGEAEGWERGPYWLDGAIPLAFVLNDEKLKARVKHWIDTILANQGTDGWLGNRQDAHAGSGESVLDPWPIALLLKAFAQWHEATGDARVVQASSRVLRRIDTLLDEKPLDNWAKMRWPELALGVQWLHGQTNEAWLLDLARKVESQGFDWRAHFDDFQLRLKQSEWTLENHVVNNAMALKEPAVRFRQDGDRAKHRGDAARYIATLDEFHGQATGVFSGDESLAGRNPTQGTELCAVVETMFSLEELLSTFGDAAFADRLEKIAFNALPATFTSDMWAHQYDQQCNQVLVSKAERDWVSNGPDSNLFGLEPNFGCCTANMHQGWPKLVKSLWMASPDGGLAAIVLAPCEVTTRIGGEAVTITTETEYPWRDSVRFVVQVARETSFPLHLRVPRWATEAAIQVNGEAAQSVEAGAFHVLNRAWKDGDVVTLRLPMKVRIERRYRDSVSVMRGPLLFALKMGEEFRHLKGEEPACDWEVHPTTPWNYGLDLSDALGSFSVCESPIGPIPFAPQNAPVTIEVRARRVPQWQMELNSAGALPQSPVVSSEPLETIELIPYGSTHLRVAEFPEVTS